jgi:tyrosyl-tRNA synthetase
MSGAALYNELVWREMLYDGTEGAREALAAGPLTGYIGFDPTASSLHVGSLLPVMALARLQRAGHAPIAVVGGGTGLIGDPSGKTQERTLLTQGQVEENVAGIRAQLARFLDFDAPRNPARIVNNADWLVPMDMMSFLRDVGKHFTVNYMIAKESVRRRLESEDGISYTEFSYLLLQAYDFVMLFDRFGCTLQLGGSDQWGNITAGIDLIRKLRGGKGHGLVLPLVTTSAGVKFGKTEAGAVWLDPARTSPFRFYQFWLNTDDRDVVRYLKFFTFLSREEIEALAAAAAERPEQRQAQRALAQAVTALVHGNDQVQRAERAARVRRRGGDTLRLRGRTVFGRDRARRWRLGRRAADPDQVGGVPQRSGSAGQGGRRAREQRPDARRARAPHDRRRHWRHAVHRSKRQEGPAHRSSAGAAVRWRRVHSAEPGGAIAGRHVSAPAILTSPRPFGVTRRPLRRRVT